jgi:transcriptional regulator with XRE-family HTH domain
MAFSETGSVGSGSPASTEEWEQRVGEQVRALRLDRGFDQATLGDLADVGVTSIKNLENGRGSSLRTVVRVLRALDATAWLDSLAPTPTVSPIDLLRGAEASPRRRVSRARSDD